MTSHRLLSLALLTATLALPAAADTRIVTAVEGTDLEPSSKTTWFGENRIREDLGDRSVIIDLEADRLILVDHEARTFQTVALPLDIASMLPPQARSAYESALERMKMDVEVSPTDETAEVAGYTATRNDVVMTSEFIGEVTVELWVSDEVPVNVSSYKQMMLEMADLQPAAGAWMKRLLEVEGYPVRVVTRAAAGGTTFERVETVTSVEEADAPAGHYAAPEGYAEKQFDPMNGMRGGS